ncbi:single-stranded-DNA-specific exonuclease RecJ [uncultured Lamprocystis sp.]|uniref:single-stranded-DNA-specific exonuclease RecJ n=1 Tax=uncultured Lamprocystis sp. TaxID=543132 RepID=UPI0025F911E3|nr:single-stranded-DNA-specific exonuclease RecJ [uncultured Lamprocystis sp.]
MTPTHIRRIGTDPAQLPAANLRELLNQLYRSRGQVESESTLGLADLAPYDTLAGLAQAVELLAATLRSGRSILVVGDYDADGATGSALAVLGLRALGTQAVAYLVPSRFAYGYGLSPPVVDAAAPQCPGLLVTVDNGIASIAGVERANQLGIPVLITDHHLAGTDLPAAAAIVNPNQPGCPFPSKHLAGVGVVFYVLAALRAHLRAAGWFTADRPEPNLAEYLDLVALGTVADVVTLDRNNRILVEQGLRRIRAGRCRPGIRALLQAAGRDPARATAADLGFYVGPRLNAAGRLTEMSLGVECLLCDDPIRALDLAGQLDALNRERREIEGTMRDQAETLVERIVLRGDDLPPGLCLYGKGWHEGVSGIVAARIRERYHRPVIAFADAADGLLRGSARSVEGLNIRDAIDLVDRRRPGLIARFGGHAMAAGLTLKPECLSDFRVAFRDAVREQLGEAPPVHEIRSDGELPPRLMNLETCDALRLGGPWGKGFPEPLFDGEFEVLSARLVGERHLKLRLKPERGPLLEAIGFGQGERLELARGRVHLAYRLDVNEYRGERTPQLILEHLQSTT